MKTSLNSKRVIVNIWKGKVLRGIIGAQESPTNASKSYSSSRSPFSEYGTLFNNL